MVVVAVATALLVPVVVTGGGGSSRAVADPSALTGMVTLPGGVPGAAAVIDVGAVSATGAVTTFARAVADASGRFSTRVLADASLRLLAPQPGGLRLRVAVTDLQPSTRGAAPIAYSADVIGTATLTPPTPARFGSIADPARRAAATLTQAVLDALAVVNPAGVLPAVTQQSASGTTLPATALTRVADLVFTNTIGSPPNPDAYVAYLNSIKDPLLRQAYQAVIDAAGGVGSLLGRYADLHTWLNRLAVYRGGGEGPDGGHDTVAETLDAVQRLVALVGGAVPDYQPWIDQGRATVDRALADALAAVPGATTTVQSLAQLVIDTALGIVNDVPGLQPVLDTAQQVVDEASAVADASLFLVGANLDAALATITPYVTTVGDAATRVANLDPDMLLGNDDVNDPDLVPPLGATMDSLAVNPADDTDLVGTLDGIATGRSSQQDPPTVSGCKTQTTYSVPARGQAQPIWGVSLDVTLWVLRCTNEENKDFDYYTLVWNGRGTNRDMGDYKTSLWRLKYRTELGAKYDRLDADPKSDVPTDGSTAVHWSVGFGSGVSASISGDYTVVKAKRIHPWADYNRTLSHVSWMSNSNNGSRGADFWDGGGLTVKVPQGDRSLAQASNLLIQTWRCWQRPQQGEVYATCDAR